MRLCEARFASLMTYDGEFFTLATHKVPADFDQWARENANATRFRPDPEMATGRVVGGESIVEIRDLADDLADKGGNPIRRALVEIGGFRTLLSVALRKDATLLGVINIARQEVLPFTDKQIALLQNFAAQAVIAMENARLLTETREALEQQTATAEVLQVINASPGDLYPVFDAMLEKGMRLCEAACGGFGVWQGDRYEIVAMRGVPQSFVDFAANNEVSPGPRAGFARVVRGEGFIHFSDVSQSKFYRSGDPLTRAIVDLGAVRTMLTVPLAKDEEVLGILVFYRREVRPFSERQSL